MKTVVYTLLSHATDLLAAQVELLRRHVQDLSAIVVVQGPFGLPTMLTGGTVRLTKACAEKMGVTLLEIPDAVAGQFWAMRIDDVLNHTFAQASHQEEPLALVVHGDLFPLGRVDVEQVLDGLPAARRGREGSNTEKTWFAFSMDHCVSAVAREGVSFFDKDSTVVKRYPARVIDPTEPRWSTLDGYTEDMHFEYCEPNWLHLDRLSQSPKDAIRKLKTVRRMLDIASSPITCAEEMGNPPVVSVKVYPTVKPPAAATLSPAVREVPEVKQGQPFLSICFPTYDDFYGLYASALDIVMSHPEVLDEIEIVVVDNNPSEATGSHGQCNKDWVTNYLAGCVRAHYVSAPGPGGPALTKQRCVDEAAGAFVLVMDSHVRVVPGALRMLIDFYKNHLDSIDLYSGPMFYDQDALNATTRKPLQVYASHMERVWRGQNLGIWGKDPRGAVFDGEPFEIPAQGCGLFTCRTKAFAGFNPHVRGFGGEEFYIHDKTRLRGGKVVCLPFLRWVHRFGRPGGPPFGVTRWDKVRNNILNHLELGQPLDDIHEHFCLPRKDEKTGDTLPPLFPQKDFDRIAVDPIGSIVAGAPAPCPTCGDTSLPDAVNLQQLYDSAKITHSDMNQHVPKLRELATGADVVVEFGPSRRVGTVAILAAQPKSLVCYSLFEDAHWKELKKRQGQTSFEWRAEDPLFCDIPECDVLFEDSKHTAGHLLALLNRHGSKVRRYIVLHDTKVYGETGEDGGPGLLVGLRQWLKANQEWSVIYHTDENNGLTVVGRLPADKPKLPSIGKMAWNYVKAVANHVATGRQLASSELVHQRLDRCSLCPHRTNNRCSVCGCFLDEGPDGAEGKALWLDSECPLGFWKE